MTESVNITVTEQTSAGQLQRKAAHNSLITLKWQMKLNLNVTCKAEPNFIYKVRGFEMTSGMRSMGDYSYIVVLGKYLKRTRIIINWLLHVLNTYLGLRGDKPIRRNLLLNTSH